MELCEYGGFIETCDFHGKARGIRLSRPWLETAVIHAIYCMFLAPFRCFGCQNGDFHQIPSILVKFGGNGGF